MGPGNDRRIPARPAPKKRMTPLLHAGDFSQTETCSRGLLPSIFRLLLTLASLTFLRLACRGLSRFHRASASPPLDSALRISFPMPFPLVPFLFLSLFSTIPDSLKKKYTSVHCCTNSPTNVSSPGPVHAVLLSFDPPALHTNRWTPTLIHPVIVRSCLDCAKRSYVPGSSADQLRHRSLIGAAGQLLASFLDRLFP